MRVDSLLDCIHILLIALVLTAACQGGNDDDSEAADPILRAGAAEVVITPDIGERYTDLDGNKRWSGQIDNPEGGGSNEPFDDSNRNGVFDPVWMCNDILRVALEVRDDLYANVMVFERNGIRTAIVGIDSFGHFHTEIERIRGMPGYADLAIDQLILGSSHSHETPDSVGIYGPSESESGVDPDWMGDVRGKVLNALVEAVANLEPATLRTGSLATGIETYQVDQRDPIIIDDTLSTMRFVSADGSRVIATLLNWGSHPEQMISDVYLSADWPGAWRREEKATHPGSIGVFIQGPLGGQIGSNRIAFSHEGVDYPAEGSFEKGDALGAILHERVESALEEAEPQSEPEMAVRSKTLQIPLENLGFQLLFTLGAFDREIYQQDGSPYPDNLPLIGGPMAYVQSEMVWMRLGDAEFLTVPGELHPELAVGGYDGSRTPGGPDRLWSPDNQVPQTLEGAPEPPYLRDRMNGRVKFVMAVTMDFLGYIIPRFNFILHPTNPYLDTPDWDHHYEETVSAGPTLTDIVNQTAAELTVAP